MFKIVNKNTKETISEWETREEAEEQVEILNEEFNEIDSQFTIVEG